MTEKKCEKCGKCGVGKYNHGSGLYDYYDCGHAYQKPIGKEDGKWIYFRSPYHPKIYNGGVA